MTGYAVIEARAHALAYVECGVLTVDARLPMERRLGDIARNLQEILGEFHPEAAAVEDVFSHHNERSALALAQARGMVLAVAGLAGVPVFSYAPASVKKMVVGRGRADKGQVAQMVAALLGLRSLPAVDAADALAVAITHCRTLHSDALPLVPAKRTPASLRGAQ
jgi:crossover junction endodeoxyribonuclease RuvC